MHSGLENSVDKCIAILVGFCLRSIPAIQLKKVGVWMCLLKLPVQHIKVVFVGAEDKLIYVTTLLGRP